MAAGRVLADHLLGERGEAVEGQAHIHGIEAEEGADGGAGREHGRSVHAPAKAPEELFEGDGVRVAANPQDQAVGENELEDGAHRSRAVSSADSVIETDGREASG